MAAIDYSSTLSSALRMARFPMILGIVVIHCFLPIEAGKDAMPLSAYNVMYFGSEILSRICVPLFFAISGFFFFYKKERIDRSFYFNQWKKRANSLLVPYIIWNILAFGFLLFKTLPPMARFFPGMEGVDLSFGKFLQSFWEFSFTGEAAESKFFDPMYGPVDFPLWFIRDLLVLFLLAPLFHCLIKIMRFALPALIAVCFVAGWWPSYCPCFSITGVLFFSVGCYLAIEKINPLEFLWKLSTPATATALLTAIYALVAIADLLTADSARLNLHIHALGILIGVAWLISLFGYLSLAGRAIPSVLTASSFFVYAFHGLISSMVCKAAMAVVHPSASISWITSYFLAIILLTAVSVAVFVMCRKILPGITNLLTGGRD